MPIRSYKDLIVWQKSMALANAAYELTERFPKEERFGLSSQIQRAAVSIPANIAEGHGRGTRMDYAHFLDISNGSLSELETLILLASHRSYLTADSYSKIEEQLEEVGRMLRALRGKVRNR
jgi:four helix bundle protein